MKDEAETTRPARRAGTRKGGDKPPAAPRAARRRVSTPSADADAAVTGTGSEATAPEATGTPVIPLRPGDAGEAGRALDADAGDRDPATAGIEALHGDDGDGTPIITLRPSISSDAGGVSSGPAAAEAVGTHVLESVPDTDADAGAHDATPTLPLPASHDRPDIPGATAGTHAVDPGDAGDRRSGGFKERALRTARIKFADDPVRSPLTSRQLDVLLDLLHEPGKDRTLVSSTWTYLERGMSYAHAVVTADKLRGTFRGGRAAA